MSISKKPIITWIALILWMALIFAFSSQPSGETNHLSIGVSQILLKNQAAASLGVDGSETAVALFNIIIRHFAHFFLFFVLGVLMLNALKRLKLREHNRIWISAAICFAYAVSDEIHQLFVPGRFSSIKDVLIDTAGAILGIAVYWMIRMIRKKISKNYPG